MDSSSNIPVQRPGVDAQTQGTVITRCDELWYKDGSIVIEAETTQFRVYQGVLAAQSDVFADMFSIPQPPTEQRGELVEGCPVVKVQDTAIDWTYVLEALIARRYTAGLLPFNVVAAFLRLGNKYNISVLKDDALKKLKHDFPSTLDDWDQLQDSYPNIEYTPNLHRYVINLARETGCIDCVLPAVFYAVFEHEGANQALSDIGPLRFEDQMILVRGWTKGMDYQQSIMGWLFDDYASSSLYESCQQMRECKAARADVIKDDIISSPVPELHGVLNWKSAEWDRIDMCSTCKVAAEAAHEASRWKFWEELPIFFGLPKWEDLLRDT